MANRMAILFGIDAYKGNELKNAKNDAEALAQKLQELGFETECFTDVTTEEMAGNIYEFSEKLKKARVGLFFFAGHGVQCENTNYLCTTDTDFGNEKFLKFRSVKLHEVIDEFEKSKVDTKIIILDACRNNPFGDRGVGNNGLAPVSAPKGTIVAFSTSPGQTASDGKRGHGVYTEALLEHIATPKLTIEDMFKRVRNTVSARTGHRQITWEHTSLMGSFYFDLGENTEGVIAKYSEYALEDARYDFWDANDIEDIVTQLKTYNWYKQNPAIDKVLNVDFENADKDDIFVLGRNIYQAACGESSCAVQWLDELEGNLNRIGGMAAIHLLNGIMYEIYYGSDGRIRNRFKLDYFKKPWQLCNKKMFEDSRAFICDALGKYPGRIIYLPGTTSELMIDILIEKTAGDEYFHIDNVCIDGMRCLYNEEETERYEFDSETWYDHSVGTLEEFEELVAKKIGAPIRKLKFTCNGEIGQKDEIYMPYSFSLCRYI